MNLFLLILTIGGSGHAAIDHIMLPSENSCHDTGRSWVSAPHSREWTNRYGQTFGGEPSSLRTYTCHKIGKGGKA